MVGDSEHRTIDDIRCPKIKGLPRDTVLTLHHTMVQVVRMRRSIESARFHLDQSRCALRETRELLGRLRREGF